MDLHGKPLLSHVIERAKRIADCGPVIIATSRLKSDDILEEFASMEGVEIFRGDLEDVAGRALDCAILHGLKGFVRICGDRPFFDPEIVNQLLEIFIQDDLDLATNVAKKTFPAGMTAEIISTGSLMQVCASTQERADREHVTRYYYNNPDKFNIYNLEWERPEDARHSFVVDTQEDMEKSRWMASQLGETVHTASINRLIELAARWSDMH